MFEKIDNMWYNRIVIFNLKFKRGIILKREKIRHHYIPQFILKHFCFDEKGCTFYVDVKTKQETKMQIRELFMEKNLYNDMINSDNPVKIEDDFARFECEMSRIINTKFINEEEFSLTLYENEALKLFFALMAFRSKSTQQLFKEGLSRDSRKIYSNWQGNRNFDDFWKRNLGKLVNCRSLQEVMQREDIDEPIKVFMMRDTFGKYFCIVEPRTDGEFILSDCYPVVNTGECCSPMGKAFELQMYDIFPISPKRVIILASVGVDNSPSDVLMLRPLVFGQPIVKEDNTRLYRVKKLYLDEVETINDMLIKNAKEGYIYKNTFSSL